MIHSSFKHGRNFKIGEHVVIKEDCEVGDDVTLKDFVRLAKGTKIGDNTVIDSYVRSSGINKIGNNVIIRYGTTIAREVRVEDGVFISPNVMTVYLNVKKEKKGGIVIGKNSFIGTNVVLGAGVTIGVNVVIGTFSFVSHCVIGDNCFIHENVNIGSQGLWVTRDSEGVLHHIKPKGKVILKKGVNIGTKTAIHRGVVDNTVIGANTFIGPNCNIGHDVKIGEHCIIITGSLISGLVEIGDYTRISPAIIKQRIKIGNHVFVGIGSLVTHNIPDGTVVTGTPAVEISKFKKHREKLKTLLD